MKDSVRQADAEIEVTPEMVEAGICVLEQSLDSLPQDALVRAVYIAMERARR